MTITDPQALRVITALVERHKRDRFDFGPSERRTLHEELVTVCSALFDGADATFGGAELALLKAVGVPRSAVGGATTER